MRELQINDPMAPSSGFGSPNANLHGDAEKIKEGSVFVYAHDMEMGVIKTLSDQRFIFAKADWHPEIMPKAGLAVTFEAAGPLALKIKLSANASS